MSTGTTPVTGPDFTALDAAVAQLEADVTTQATLEANYETAEAALSAGNEALASANDARQAGLVTLSSDQAAVAAAVALLLTPAVDPNATPAAS